MSIAGSRFGHVAFTSVGNTNNSVRDVSCAVSVLFDDVLNGNITNDQQHYFMGTKNLYEKLNTIWANVTALANDLKTNAEADMMALQVKATTAMGSIEVLPNTSPFTNFVLVYTDPTPRSSSTQVNSEYSTLLGNAGVKGSLCGNLYSGVSGLKGLLDTGVNGLNGFDPTVFSNTQIGVTQSIQGLQNDIIAMDSKLDSGMQPVRLGIDVLDGFMVVFHASVILSVALIIAYVILAKRLHELFPCLPKPENQEASTVVPPASEGGKL